MTDEMAGLLAKKFIQRRDAKAIQKIDGEYTPVCDWSRDADNKLVRGALHPFMLSDLQAHLAGTSTYGHYLIDTSDQVKLFAFDIDLEKEGAYCTLPDLSGLTPDQDVTEEQYRAMVQVTACNPREDWLNRAHPARPWLKSQLRLTAELLSRTVWDLFDGTVPVATAYSGSKGLHVYAFAGASSPTGSISAAEARLAAEMVMDATGKFELFRGKNFFRAIDQDPFTGYPNLSVEIFPKQGSLESKDLGNLMRLPLGRNLKSKDPTFFVDQRAPLGQLVPHPDPVALLNDGNPWK